MGVLVSMSEHLDRRDHRPHSGPAEYRKDALPDQGHLSVLKAAGEDNDSPGDVGALEGAFTRDTLEFFDRLQQIERCRVRLLVSAAEIAVSLAALIVNQSQVLLNHAASLLSTDHTVGDSDAKIFPREGENVPRTEVARDP